MVEHATPALASGAFSERLSSKVDRVVEYAVAYVVLTKYLWTETGLRTVSVKFQVS